MKRTGTPSQETPSQVRYQAAPHSDVVRDLRGCYFAALHSSESVLTRAAGVAPSCTTTR